eukprot:6491930-Amphidinium_carterae.3
MRNDIPGLGADGVRSAITTCHIVLDKLRETYDVVPVTSLLFPPGDPHVEEALQEFARKARAVPSLLFRALDSNDSKFPRNDFSGNFSHACIGMSGTITHANRLVFQTKWKLQHDLSSFVLVQQCRAIGEGDYFLGGALAGAQEMKN